MSASKLLQQLYSLDTSSPEFLPRLYCLIQNDEEEQYLSSLQGSESARLVDFLDEVLDAISITDDVSRRCLHKLQAICNQHKILPASYKVPGDIARIGSHPVTSGGFSDVWEGLHNDRKVCIKYLRITQLSFEAVERRFYKEAIMWKRFRHPNIVPFIGVTQNPWQFVSEWMPNGTLTEYLGKNPGADRVRLLLDVAEGLAFLHASHTTHGDLKGPNVLIDHDGRARLSDFGFSSVIRGISSVLVTKVQGYSPRWAAPEVLDSGDKNTREADVFAFGMVVIEVFTGNYPFCEFTDSVAIAKIMDGERPDRPKDPDLTDSVWVMTLRCWLEDPVLRPIMPEVVAILRECYRLYIAKEQSPTSTTPLPAAGPHNTAPISDVSMDLKSTPTHPPGIDGGCIESPRIIGLFEQLKMDEQSSTDSNPSPSLLRSKRGAAWLRDQDLQTINSALGTLPEPSDGTSLPPESEVDYNNLTLQKGPRGRYYYQYTSTIVAPNISTPDTGTGGNSSVVGNSPSYRLPLAASTSLDSMPIRDHGQIYPDAHDVTPSSIGDPGDSVALFHRGVTCAHCLRGIVGARFHCITCYSVDICSSCEFAGLPGNLDSSDGGHDSSHVMIKIPYPAEPSRVQEFSHLAVARWNGGNAENVGQGGLLPEVRHPHPLRLRSRSSFDGTVGLSGVGPANGLNHGVRCDSCTQVILGTRYQCGNCPTIPHSYNLCQSCDDKSYMVHDPTHIFFKLPRPVDRPIESTEPILPPLYEYRVAYRAIFDAHDPKAYLQSVIHGNIFCDFCMDQIRGQWFHCMYCPMDLCDQCEAVDDHDRTHFFMVAKSPIGMNRFYRFARIPTGDVSGAPIMTYSVYYS